MGKKRRLGSTHDVTDTLQLKNRSSLYELRKRENFPRPFKVGRRLLWDLDEVDAWLEDQRCPMPERLEARASA